MTNQAILYMRFSPKPKKAIVLEDRQESIETQRQHCRAYCERAGLSIVLEIEEPGVSGYSLRICERVGGLQLLDALKTRKYKHVVVMRLDRLSRKASDVLGVIEEWQDRKIALHLANQSGNSINAGTPEGMLFLTMLAGFGEFERGLIATRTSQSKARYARQKQHGACQIPIGYRLADGNSLEVCPAEEATIARAKELHALGHSLRQIARMLESEGRLCRGSSWHAETIRRMVG